jgi:predicted CXXCH cytochrome family protein
MFFLAAIFTLLSFGNYASAQDVAAGKTLFQNKCASCHNPLKDATGPKLKGADQTVPSKEWLYSWVKNSSALIASGDKYANELYAKWNKTAMTSFPDLSHEDIDNIFAYVNSVEEKVAGPSVDGTPAPEKDNTWIYAIATAILAILVFILSRVNRTLEKVTNEKRGIANKKDAPWYRNKVNIAVIGVVLLALAGYWIANGSIEMGRQQNYMPEQPIFYSHKVHAGVNQINCQYCHSAADASRQAMIPSTNVCMNCHMQINEYTGDQLYTHEGKKVDGTAEIHKLYEYAGWDPVKKSYKYKENGEIDAKPIEWVKIHNLPDHVYFNHAQHVNVGQVQCQSCHGPIQEMDEVYQFAPLSMGWCINCHRTTEVKFQENGYYQIFEKYHQEIKDGKRTGVTEAELGGLDCQKCHY